MSNAKIGRAPWGKKASFLLAPRRPSYFYSAKHASEMQRSEIELGIAE